MDNFLTRPSLLRLLKSKSIAATGTLKLNLTENSPLISVEEMKKKPRGTCDAINDRKCNVTLVRWKRQQSCHSSINTVWKRANKESKPLHQRKRRRSRNE